MKCCDIPSPATTCIPSERSELIQECDNLNGTLPIKCTFMKSVGVGVSMSFESGDGSDISTLHKEYEQNEAYGFYVDNRENVPFWFDLISYLIKIALISPFHF